MAVQGGEDVYATLLLSDNYLPGALVLAHSLRDGGTTKKLAVLVTLDTVSAEVTTQLKAAYDYVIPVPRIKNEKPANLQLMNRPDLHSAFTKVNLWKQTQFRKIVYIDADVVAFRPPDELFDLPHDFAAAPDIGWPDLFNTGVMVLAPNLRDYYALMAMAERGISFDGADQGLLNMYFRDDYHRLPFTYNVTPSAHYQYVPAYRHFQSGINMVHFIGAEKPWMQGRGVSTGSNPYDEMVGKWWAVYDKHYGKDKTAPPAESAQAPEPGAPPPPPPELVQYFVKGEYQPKIAYVVPTGEPPLDQGVATYGQHYAHPPPPAHDFSQPEHPYQPPQHGEQHPHPEYHYPPALPHEQPQQQQQHYHHPPPPPQQHHAEQSQPPAPLPQPEQSQPPASLPQPEQSFSAPSVSFGPRAVEGAQAEAREEQVPGPQYGAPPPPPPGPEHKPEQPQPTPTGPSWDAQRQPPPEDSQPEALNFPQTHYEMSSDTAPFVPPERYPSPPRDMWYQVPEEPPAAPSEPPRPIFPWESHRPEPTRVFAGDEPAHAEPPPSEPSGQLPASHGPGAPAEPSMTGSSSMELRSEPATPTTPVAHGPGPDPWATFTMTNAWDEVPEIERYVDTLQKHPRIRARGRGVPGAASPGRLSGFGGGLGGPGRDTFQVGGSFRTRGSRVTDFPSEVERPSLPVTPAPVRRGKFWGGGSLGFADDEGDDDQLLPAAEGVPQQADWDPVAQLQKLAQQHAEGLQLRLGSGEAAIGGEEGGREEPHRHREIPRRPLPFGSEDIGRSPTYVAHSAPLLSPQPVKPGAATSSVRNIIGSGDEQHVHHDDFAGSSGFAAIPRMARRADEHPELAAELSEEEAARFGPRMATTRHAWTRDIPEPSYQGPGLMFEKDEEVPDHGVTAALPTEEEQDVLET